VSGKKPYRLLAFLDGRMIEDTECDNWVEACTTVARVGQVSDTIQVRYLNNLVLLYRSEGIY